MPYRAAALTYIGVLIGFKLWSFFLIYLFWGGLDTVGYLLGTHVLWFLVPAIAFAAPALFWFRLLRVRRRRRELEEAEWNVHETPRAQR